MAFGFYGGKTRISDTIADLLYGVDTRVYAELFGGSAAVLLNKAPHKHEVYADRSLALCCFWQCMSCAKTASALIDTLGCTTYGQESFDASREQIDRFGDADMRVLSGDDILAVAAACFTVYTAGRDNAGLRFSAGRFPTNDAYLRTVGRLGEVADRFRGVTVKHGDAIDLLDREYNTSDTLIYLDPTYLPEVGRRRSRNHTWYTHTLDYKNHVKLLRRIRRSRAKIIISGYEDSTRIYDRYLVEGENCALADFTPWVRREIDTISVTARGDKRRTEILWSNYG